MALAILELDPREEFENGIDKLKAAEADQNKVVDYLRSQGMIVLPYEPKAHETDTIDSIAAIVEPDGSITRSGVIMIRNVQKPGRIELLATGFIPGTESPVRLYVDTNNVPATSVYGDTFKAYGLGGKVRDIPYVSLSGHIDGEVYRNSWPVGEKTLHSMPVIPQKSRLPLEAMF